MKTATEAIQERLGREQDERSVHSNMARFVRRWAPDDRHDAAEFQADLALVLQAVHRDASRETHALLAKALMAMPPGPIFIDNEIVYEDDGEGCGVHYDEQAMANAALIAAAPELYEALAWMVEHDETDSETGFYAVGLKLAVAALAKARGGQSP